MIKIKFHIDAGAGEEMAECMTFTTRMPFVPHKGMMIVAMPGDDFRKVELVYWSKAYGVEVFLEDSHWKISAMKKLGWRIVK